jgi:hypothetical protein
MFSLPAEIHILETPIHLNIAHGNNLLNSAWTETVDFGLKQYKENFNIRRCIAAPAIKNFKNALSGPKMPFPSGY